MAAIISPAENVDRCYVPEPHAFHPQCMHTDKPPEQEYLLATSIAGWQQIINAIYSS